MKLEEFSVGRWRYYACLSSLRITVNGGRRYRDARDVCAAVVRWSILESTRQYQCDPARWQFAVTAEESCRGKKKKRQQKAASNKENNGSRDCCGLEMV
jgi:hypothetical protein